MSIASEIQRLQNNIASAYEELEAKGAVLPQSQNSANLADTIGAIPAELTSNKAASITAANKDSDALYTSVKAVVDYVDSTKAPVINVETAESYDTDISALPKVTDRVTAKVSQNTALNYPYLLLSKHENLLPEVFTELSVTGEKNGVTVEFVNANSIRINGTCTADFWVVFRVRNNTFQLDRQINTGESITIGAVASGIKTEGRPYFTANFRDSSGNNVFSKNIYCEALNGGVVQSTATATGDSPQLNLSFKVIANVTYTDFLITPFIFLGTDVTVIENPTFVSGLCDVTSAVSDYSYLSTYPNQHIISYKADTKTYVDEHIPEIDLSRKEDKTNKVTSISASSTDTQYPTAKAAYNGAVAAANEKVTYITPEQYGAKGDGVTDDTAALQQCLSMASSARCIKALKQYKITSTLYITGNELNIDINRINSYTDSFAVQISTRNSKVSIRQIDAYDNDGYGVLIKSSSDSNVTNVLPGVQANSFEFNLITAKYDCIKFEADEPYNNAYNNFKVPNLISRSGNLININYSAVENYFWGGRITCYNGWCIYHTGKNTFMRFAFEATSQICCGANARFIDCRTLEALDNPGIFLKMMGGTASSISREIADLNTPVIYDSVDLSEAISFEDAIASIDRKITDDPDISPYYACREVITYAPAIIQNVCMKDETGTSNAVLLDGKMIIYWNKKAFVPNREIMEEITATPFVPMDTVLNNPTYFKIGVADCVINLNDSYCPVGIKSFIVEQTSSYKATIYNKNNTLVFDGANLPAGKYQVSCYITPLSSSVFDDVMLLPSNAKDYYAKRIRYIYTGTNEEWSVMQLA